MLYELQIAVAKVARHAAAESGDTVEIIERPGGGISVVLVDGQGSGRGAKSLSNLIVTRAIAQLKDGARDGVVARGVHDYLYTYRMGQVAATLNILSYDQRSGSLISSRNNPAPFFVLDREGVQVHAEPSSAIGLEPATKPRISEIALRSDTYVVMFTDGLLKAGERYGADLELENVLAGWPTGDGRGAGELAEMLLERAVALDHGQPSDDMTVVVLAVLAPRGERAVRRMLVRFPVEPAGAADPHAADDEEDLG